MYYQPTLRQPVPMDVQHTAGSFPGWPPAPGAFRRSRSCLVAGRNIRDTSHPRQIESPRVAISQVRASPRITRASGAPPVPRRAGCPAAPWRPGERVALKAGGGAFTTTARRPRTTWLWDYPHMALPCRIRGRMRSSRADRAVLARPAGSGGLPVSVTRLAEPVTRARLSR